MGRASNASTYKSPIRKLVSFFRRSRDGWRAKAEDRNLRIKWLRNQIAALKESRRKWKEKARGYQARIAARSAEEASAGKKNRPA